MYEELLSDKVKVLKPSGIRKFFDLAATREGVISLGVGEPDFATPWHIREAAIYSIKQGKNVLYRQCWTAAAAQGNLQLYAPAV